MTHTVFINDTTVIDATWLNDVDTATYTTVPSNTLAISSLHAAGGAALVGNTPAGNIASTTVQAALNELDTEKALLAGSASQVFSVGTAVSSSHAVRLDQIGRRVSQIVATSTGVVATGTTIIPLDNTIPQNTEGDQYMSLSITPTNVNSTLEIEVQVNAAHSAPGIFVIASLFQDTIANALSTGFEFVGTANSGCQVTLKYQMLAGTLSSTTFKVRAGGHGAGTLTFNGSAGAQIFGGTFNSYITITEYLP